MIAPGPAIWACGFELLFLYFLFSFFLLVVIVFALADLEVFSWNFVLFNVVNHNLAPAHLLPVQVVDSQHC